ncbi:uncharacterized protein LOC111250910 isoform X2 [Varroa destructor]|uniref:Uncharacterized protein n=1 Tax=Varroa destructor TaxID=109461 RepID=A0A7M7K8A1_VARDE|nr:uncharacterized protein LOC111250910 isoform X2 [Varroa destructor]
MSFVKYVKDILDTLPTNSAGEKLDTLLRLMYSLSAKFLQLQLVNQHALAMCNLKSKILKEKAPDVSKIPSLHGPHFYFSNSPGIQLINSNCLEPRTVVGHQLAKGALAAATGRYPEVGGIQMPRTTLLYGPNGVGKSLLLRLLAEKVKYLRTQTAENVENVNFVATCIKPWELPDELLDQFETRILMPLPNAVERLAILKLHLPKTAPITLEQMIDFVNDLEGYSGGIIKQIVENGIKLDLAELVDLSQKYQQNVNTLEEYWGFVELEIVRLGRAWNSKKKKIPKRGIDKHKSFDAGFQSTSGSPIVPSSLDIPRSSESTKLHTQITSAYVGGSQKKKCP